MRCSSVVLQLQMFVLMVTIGLLALLDSVLADQCCLNYHFTLNFGIANVIACGPDCGDGGYDCGPHNSLCCPLPGYYFFLFIVFESIIYNDLLI